MWRGGGGGEVTYVICPPLEADVPFLHHRLGPIVQNQGDRTLEHDAKVDALRPMHDVDFIFGGARWCDCFASHPNRQGVRVTPGSIQTLRRGGRNYFESQKKNWGQERREGKRTVHNPAIHAALVDQADLLAMHVCPGSLDVRGWNAGRLEEVRETRDDALRGRAVGV